MTTNFSFYSALMAVTERATYITIQYHYWGLGFNFIIFKRGVELSFWLTRLISRLIYGRLVFTFFLLFLEPYAVILI